MVSGLDYSEIINQKMQKKLKRWEAESVAPCRQRNLLSDALKNSQPNNNLSY